MTSKPRSSRTSCTTSRMSWSSSARRMGLALMLSLRSLDIPCLSAEGAARAGAAAQSRSGRAARPGGHGWFVVKRLLYIARQLDREPRARSWLTVGMDRPMMRLDDQSRDGEPEPQATMVRRRDDRMEALEDLFQLGRRNAHAVVADDQPNAVAVALHDDFDRSSRPVFERVLDQVRHDLFQAHPVPPSRDASLNLDTYWTSGGRRLLGEAVHHLAREIGQVHHVQLQSQPLLIQPRHVEQGVYQRLQSAHLPLAAVHDGLY